jgi:very-short-patch-repair endonuclease
MTNKELLLKNGTKSEKTVFQILRKILGSRVKTQQPFLIRGRCYYADICVKSKKVIIEVDGGYHLTPEQKEKDKQRDDDFKSIGYTTLRIYNSKSKDIEYIKNLALTLKRKDFSPQMLRECCG